MVQMTDNFTNNPNNLTKNSDNNLIVNNLTNSQVNNNNFCGNLTFDEWAKTKDVSGFEFQSVLAVHKEYPSWNLEEIKEYVPRFLSRYTRHVKSVNRHHPDLDIGTVQNFISDYIVICETCRDIYIELFGCPPANMTVFSKWISIIAKISRLWFEHPSGGSIDTPKYKNKDEFGHSSTYSFRLNGKVMSFRSDEQLGRDIAKIRDDNRHRFETQADFLKEIVTKGVSVYTLINSDTITGSKDILLSMERRMEEERELSKAQRRDDINSYFSSKLEYLEDTVMDIDDEQDRLELLKIFKNEIEEFLKDNITYYIGNMDMKILIKRTIMGNRDLERILKKLEDKGLITKEYRKCIIEQGTVLGAQLSSQEGDDILDKRQDISF